MPGHPAGIAHTEAVQATEPSPRPSSAVTSCRVRVSRLVAAVAARHPHPEQAGAGQRLDGLVVQPPVLLLPSGVLTQQRHQVGGAAYQFVPRGASVALVISLLLWVTGRVGSADGTPSPGRTGGRAAGGSPGDRLRPAGQRRDTGDQVRRLLRDGDHGGVRLPRTWVGMTLASTTRSPSSPLTRSCRPPRRPCAGARRVEDRVGVLPDVVPQVLVGVRGRRRANCPPVYGASASARDPEADRVAADRVVEVALVLEECADLRLGGRVGRGSSTYPRLRGATIDRPYR